MSKTTLNMMCRIENRLNSLLYLEATHCGHEVEVSKANKSYKRLMAFIEKEIEQLVQKAGLP